MNSISTKHPFASIVVFAALISGCATTQPIPTMSHAQSSGLAIDLTLIMPLGFPSYKPDQVYFIETDNRDGLLQQGFIRSNFINDGRAYLLNAQPGTYAAVGALFVDFNSHRRYTTYFAKDLVEQSNVTVPENDFVFMGIYLVKTSTDFDGADETQAHYKNVISPGESTGWLSMVGGPVHYLGALRERKNDEQTRNEFVRNAKEDLAGNEWAARIK
jgi:hypothetical protein